jgi:hypothetical protein
MGLTYNNYLTDTDSFVYEIKAEDCYADMKGMK